MSYLPEFAYVLWTTDDGAHCWVRIKKTKEEIEVSREVFRELRKEEDKIKQLKEEPDPTRGVDSIRFYEINHPLSLDQNAEESESDRNPVWLISRDTPELQASAEELEKQLLQLLTERQRDCYFFCMVGGGSIASFARKNGISKQSAYDTFVRIKQKLKNLIEEP